MLAVYIISLGIAAGVVGSFVRQVFTQFGYVPGFASGLYVTLGAAFLFAAAQLLYLTILRAYQPTRSPAIYSTEALSQLSMLLLFPALLNVPVPGLPDNLAQLAPFAYIGVSVAFHAVFKFMSFYAALVGESDYDRPILVWFAVSILLGLCGVLGFAGWQRGIEAARVTAGDAESLVAIGNQYANARVVQEGAEYSGVMEGREKPIMALRFGNLDAGLRESPPVERVYASVTIEGRRTTTYQSSVALHDDRWAEILVPTSYFPPDATRYSVYWTRRSEPNWQRILGLRPIVYNLPASPGEPAPPPAEVYLSGPSIFVDRESVGGLNLLVVVVDGLAANHLALFGYDRDATPAIDRLGVRSHLFPKTRAAGADTAAGLEAIVSGRDPTALAGSAAPVTLPGMLAQSGFATAAFIESGIGEAFYTQDWATAFQIFEERPFPHPELGDGDDSGETLGRVRQWISDHQGVPFFCLVRLRTVAEVPDKSAPIEDAFKVTQGDPRDIDVYDSALLRLDRQLGALFKYIRDYETRSNTAIVLTSTYGLEFSPANTRRVADVPTESVPLIIETPERRQLKYPNDVQLYELAYTLAHLAQVRIPSGSYNRSLVP